MDLNPTKYPMLSYLSRLSTFRSKPTSPSSTSDIEQPSTPPRPSPDEIAFTQFQENLREKMPHLNDPDVISSMKLAVSDVSKTRSVLQALGDRPDHETVDTARLKIVEIEESLSKKIEEMILGPKPQGVEDPKGWEENKEVELKLEAEKEREIYKAVVRLDEMHEAYECLLREAENRLMKIYRTAAEAGVGGSSSSRDKGKEKMEEEDDVSEDVIAVLLEGEKNGMRKVELAEKKLKILPEAFGRIPGVVSFDVSGNEIKVLPDSLGGLTLLEELYLSSNLLESLPDSIGLLLNLKVLDVSSNKLKAFPDSISHCRSLVQLDAGYNALAYLPTNIGFELVNLIRLSVQYNKLRSLPSSICEMRSLRYLDAHFNELRGLPYSIAKLTNLEVLNLGSNFSDLKDLPSTFGDLVSLRELDLSNNQIHALPDNFGRLQNLRMLNLEQNPIVVPPVEVVNAGVEAVKEYMVKRYDTMRAEEEERIKALEIKPDQAGWVKRGSVLLTRSTSALSYMASSVTDSVNDYLAGGKKPPNDPYLDQQL